MDKTNGRTALVLAAVAIAAVACGPSPPSTSPPSTSPPPSAAPEVLAELAWLPRATELHVREIETGHSGLTETHLDLTRRDGSDSFVGVASETHRQRPGEAPRMLAREVEVSGANVVVFLEAARDALGAPARPPGARDVVASDTSRTTMIAIDVIARERHVQLFCDEAQDEPQPWQVRRAEHPFSRALPREGQVKLTAAYRSFAKTWAMTTNQ